MLACSGSESESGSESGSGSGSGSESGSRSASGSASASGSVRLPAGVQRGVSFAHNYQGGGARGYGSEVARGQLDELRALGATWVSVTPFLFASSLQDEGVQRVTHRAGETDDRTRQVIHDARERGLRVLLKPHLWVRGGAWRAELAPPDWGAWFDAYQAVVLHYAELAQQEGVALLAVGTELRSSLRHTERWRALIAAVREIFGGELVYCANWDAAEDVRFWDALDYVGVQFYPSLADAPTTDERAMALRLDEALDRLQVLHERTGRPVLLTEFGYKSARGAEVRPYEWTERSDAPLDLEAQARAYRVFFGRVRERDFVRGVYLWKWFTDPDTQEEGPRGFSPRGKPALEVLRRAFATPPRTPRSPTPTP